MNKQHENFHPNRLFVAAKKIAAVALALVGIGLILWLDSGFMNYVDMPKLSRDMSYGLLILIGFLTSFHCVGMCGPLILGYTTKSASSGHKSYSAHFLYGIGKTISYTLFGALFGAFGSIIAFTSYMQGAVGVAAGAFLVLFGLHMLEIFPALNHFQFKTPKCVMRFIGHEYRKHSNPFVIGLLNGLMIICGPLQAMYVMATGAGNWLQGAAILFFFGIGSLPLLLGFGFLTSLLSANLTPKLLKVSGCIVIILGAIMLNRGLTVTGAGTDFKTLLTRATVWRASGPAKPPASETEQTITMEVLSSKFKPNQFILRKGLPVKWIINAKELNACNKVIAVPRYELEIKLQPGLQTIEFTPPESGVVPWSCWMGMIPGSFIIVDNEVGNVEEPAVESGPQYLLRELKHLWQRLKTAIRSWLA